MVDNCWIVIFNSEYISTNNYTEALGMINKKTLIFIIALVLLTSVGDAKLYAYYTGDEIDENMYVMMKTSFDHDEVDVFWNGVPVTFDEVRDMYYSTHDDPRMRIGYWKHTGSSNSKSSVTTTSPTVTNDDGDDNDNGHKRCKRDKRRKVIHPKKRR